MKKFTISSILILWVSLAAPAADTKPGRDAEVISIAIEYFRQSVPDNWVVPKELRERKKVVVYDSYPEFKSPMSLDQIHADMTGKNWTLPESLLLAMQARVAEKPVFDFSKLPESMIAVNSAKAMPFGLFGFADAFPTARFYVRPWPPGFSADGGLAVVRLSFGPTPHGASITLLLELIDGRWRVKHYALSFYA